MRVCPREEYVDKIFVDEAVSELHNIIFRTCCAGGVFRFFSGEYLVCIRTDNPWDEAVQLVLPSLYLPLDIPGRYADRAADVQRKTPHCRAMIRRINERIPVVT